MNITLLKEVQQACGDLKLSSKKVGRKSNGCFRVRNFDDEWRWALVTVGHQDAATILAAAKLSDTSEAKLAAILVALFLRDKMLPVVDRDDLSILNECRAQGRKFLGGRSVNGNVWVQIGMTERLVEATRLYFKFKPMPQCKTDYQRVSEILHRAAVDLRDTDNGAVVVSEETENTALVKITKSLKTTESSSMSTIVNELAVEIVPKSYAPVDVLEPVINDSSAENEVSGDVPTTIPEIIEPLEDDKDIASEPAQVDLAEDEISENDVPKKRAFGLLLPGGKKREAERLAAAAAVNGAKSPEALKNRL